MTKKLLGIFTILWFPMIISIHAVNAIAWLFIGLFNYDRGTFSLFLFCVAITIIAIVVLDYTIKKNTPYNTQILIINFLIATGILFLLCTEEWAWVLLMVRLFGMAVLKLGATVIGQSQYKDLTLKELFS